MIPATKPCERCGGSGRTPRMRRRREDGSLDPFDIVGRHHEVCDRCGGDGKEPANPFPSPARHRGYAADLA